MNSSSLPKGFVYLLDPRIILSMDYCDRHNFTGRAVKGYLSPVCILTMQAANALIQVQDNLELLHPHYRLKIFDAYRPVTATRDFKDWEHEPEDIDMKTEYHPHLNKYELFEQGYIAEQSSHSRGSTVDLTIVENEKELDMGTRFDFFGERSHTDYKGIAIEAQQNRLLLKNLMHNAGFVNLPLEWWHYTLKEEPFPNTYFDFPVR